MTDDEQQYEAPLLELSTIEPVRPRVKIKSKVHPEGKLYELAQFADISLIQQQELSQRGGRLAELVARQTELTSEEKLELEDQASRLLLIAVPELEAEVREELGGGQKVTLLETFIAASPELAKAAAEAKQQQAAKVAAALTPPIPPIGEK